MSARPRHDPHADLRSEIRIIYPILIGGLLGYWILTSWSLGWSVAALIAFLWARSAFREPAAQEAPSRIRATVLADSPGPWAEWRVRTIAD